MNSFQFALRGACAGLLGLVLALSAGSAGAAATTIAKLPVLNIDGTGTVKPNLMLLYDNSGSMGYTYTPDFVDDNTTCRGKLVMSSGTVACSVGHPPYNSPDFNRQYYNPKVRYLPAVYSDGTYYPSQTRTVTTGWTIVSTDAFGRNNSDLLGANVATSNLATNFPDLKWCTGTGTGNNININYNDCVFNTATYTYPSDAYSYGVSFGGNPYYYSIMAAEYCTDANMTTCVSTAVGADAPIGYPVPAKVRYCTTSALTVCQAKYVGNYKYPRFSNANSGVVGAYGTITIGAWLGTSGVNVTSVSVTESSGTVVISNGSVSASTNGNSTTRIATLATDLAASIIAKTGLVRQYTACVKTPTGNNSASVPTCGSLGITLATNGIVAVVPIICPANAANKAIGTCALVVDGSRNGWAVSAQSNVVQVSAVKPAIAKLVVSGSGKSNPVTSLSGLTLNGVSIMNPLSFSASTSSATAAAAIAAAISGPGVTALRGGANGACTTNTSTVCISTTTTLTSGQLLVVGTVANNNSLGFAPSATAAGTAAVNDTVPMTFAPIGAGSQVFGRVDIVPTRTSYPKDVKRTDCAGTTCTYDEEMTNFANWYTYYKSRNQMMKTAVGQAFNPLTANYNVGIASLSGASSGTIIARPRVFNAATRTTWFSSLYGMTASGGTPLRMALHTVGKMYSNTLSAVQTAGDEVVQFPCQQNFTFLTTDGYWNGDPSADVVSNDEVASTARFCSVGQGCVDPRSQTAASLSDVALYWYNGGSNGTGGSLRPLIEDMNKAGLVPAPAGENTHLHMNTYTLGLGVDGIMTYEDNYDTAPIPGGDFSNLINGVTTGCSWNNGGAYVWPDPVVTDTASNTIQTRVDDLWHAAINGHGKYFRASEPTQVVSGLQSALSNIASRVGAASAASTSSPNISQADNDVFSNTFATVKWYGVLTDKKVDIVTGATLPTEIWNTSNTVGTMVAAATDTRVIKMLNPVNRTLKDFTYANMTATEKTWFDNKCTELAQCVNLATADRAIVNTGATIVNWLRGQQQYANDVMLRAYGKSDTALPIVLGDIASSKPAYVRDPRRSYLTAGYSEFKAAKASRQANVYVAANDGMLHAFDAVTGNERWAYVPRITMKKLYIQASTTYGSNHQYTTDGSPEVSDVQINGVWKSVLVAGLNGGGRGFYAVDVTDPLAPVALWETCADNAVCTDGNYEPEMGLSFGNPQMGLWKPSAAEAAKWVVFLTSGYNNIPGVEGGIGGSGAGWLMIVDIATGQVLSKVSTGSGDTATPSGLTRITGITANPVTDPLITYVYGGDVLGQMWRFDLTAAGAPTVLRMGNAGTLQPITTRPDVTLCAVSSTANGVTTVTNKTVVTFGTGRLLDVSDVANADVQGLYVMRDTGTGIAAGTTAAQWRATMAQESMHKTTTNGVDAYTISGPDVNLAAQQGWYSDFNQNTGERVNLDVKIVKGTLNVVTTLPSASSTCSVGGKSNIYALDVCTAKGDTNNVIGAGLSSNSAAVGYVIVSTQSGSLKIKVTKADGTDETLSLGLPKTPVSRRAGWRRIQN